MNVTLRVPAPLLPTLALPALLALSACNDDLESRNAALGLDEEAAPEVTIERPAGADAGFEDEAIDELPAEDRVAFAPLPPGSEESEETVVDAAPDDLIDRTEGFAPEPMDDAAGFNPSPHVHNSGE